MRTASLWLVMLTLPVAFGLCLVLGYYAYQKLSFPAVFCSPFGRIDAALGWTLAPDA